MAIFHVRELEASRPLRSWLRLALSIAVPLHIRRFRANVVPRILLIASLTASLGHAQNTFTSTVPATANIFTAGFGLAPAATFTAAAGQTLTFQNVAGTVYYGPSDPNGNGPNGQSPVNPAAETSGSNFNSQGGISGFVDVGNVFFLVGVFLDDSAPSGAPPPILDFTGNEHPLTQTPLIGQTFFVGTGVASAGGPTQFHVPPTATRLFLGFADGDFFTGDPREYGDNTGSISAVFSVSSCVKPDDIDLYVGGDYSLNGQPTTIFAKFTPTDSDGLPIGLSAAEVACGVDHFNWEQTVDELPDPSPFFQVPNIHLTSRSTPFQDPPPGGYTNFYRRNPPWIWNSAPFYWVDELSPSATGCAADVSVPNFYQLAQNETDNTLCFDDTPEDSCLLGGSGTGCNGFAPMFSDVEFTTKLVGVGSDGTVSEKFKWNWKTTFNGTTGGIASLSNPGLADPGSGTGGVTISGVNGKQLYPLSSNQVAVSSSGLEYSRVTQTFIGNITIRNVSAGVIDGPIEVVMMSLTPGVVLENANGKFVGNSYISLSLSELQPGLSLVIPIQFKNQANSKIVFYPVVYSGGIN